MAHVFRLILATLALLGSGYASALVPLTSSTDYVLSVGGSPRYFSSLGAACDAYVSQASNELYVYTVVGTGSYADPSLVYCSVEGRYRANGVRFYSGNVTVTKRAVSACPVNSTASGSGCSCNGGFEEKGDACVPRVSDHERICREMAGSPATALKVRASGMDKEGRFCAPMPYVDGLPDGAGCVEQAGSVGIKTTDANGVEWWQGSSTSTAQTCIGSVVGGSEPGSDPDARPESEDVKKDPCPSGQAGQVNGTQVCVPYEPDKGIEGVDTSTKKNEDGSSTETKKETKCEGGRCTTTTTTTIKDASGSVTGTSTSQEEQSIGQMCAKDPGNQVCTSVGLGNGKGGDSFTGDCLSGFTATSDDAVVNAMALEQHKRNCQLFQEPEPTDETKAYEEDKAKGKEGKDLTGDLPGSKTVNVSELDLQGSSLINVSDCIADVNVVVMGRSISLPFSMICPYLSYMGTILVMVAYLMAARIIVRG